MSESAASGLDSILDSIPDDLSLAEITAPGGPDIEVAEEPQEAEQEPEAEASDAEADDEPQEAAPAKSDEDDLVEVEWYGQKGKLSKKIADYQNKHFTEKNQRLSDEFRAKMAEVEAKAAEADRKLREAEEYRELLEAHLQENPQFQESWRRAELKQEPMKRELEAVRKQFNDFIENQQRQQAEAQVQAELSNLASRYKIAEGSGFEKEDIERLALSEVITSGYQVPLEHAYQKAVAKANSKASASKMRRLQASASTQERVPSPVRPGSPIKSPTKKAPKKSLDDLLEYHLSMPDAAFSRGF